jgi:(R,R)-butanediol dehydrogenase / meso-butanediol dehydrogenase / diacetyl reductase
MKAALIYGSNDVRIEEINEPNPPGPGEVTLKVSLVGLCGTDAHEYLSPTTRSPRREGPLILGHEVVGQIIAIGPGVRRLQVGQRVVPGAGMWCGQCQACLRGQTNICDTYMLYGIQEHGGLAQYATFPAKMCFPVAEDCPDEVAVLAQPLAVALHALRMGEVEKATTIALFGLGGMGILLLAALQGHPTHLFVIDLDPTKRERAKALGASLFLDAWLCDPVLEVLRATNGVGVDLAIEASGSPQAIIQAVGCLRKGGTLLQVGIPARPTLLPLGTMVVEQKRIVTTNGHVCAADLPHALELLSTTSLAQQIATQTIALEHLVEDGLLPLALHQTSKKILVALP